MSDSMEDLRTAIEGIRLVGDQYGRSVADEILQAIENAGYRIVKPDNWTLCADGRFVNKTDNRAAAIRFILEARDGSDFVEVMDVPRTRASLIAELKSLKGVGK